MHMNQDQSTLRVLDSFEWGGSESVSNHYNDGGSGDLNDWSAQNGTVIRGTHTLQGSGGSSEIHHGSETIDQGFTVEWYHRSGGTANPDVSWFVYAAADRDNHYFAGANFENSWITIRKDDAGAASGLQTQNTDETLQADTTYRLELTYDDGTVNGNPDEHVLRIYKPDGTQIGKVSTVDSSVSTGTTIGWATNSTNNHWIDDARVLHGGWPFVDSFEDGGMTEYNYTNLNNSDQTVGTGTSDQIHESASLEFDNISTGGDFYISTPGNGLDYYPVDGDVISAYLQEVHDADPIEPTQPMIAWYADTNENMYSAMISDSSTGPNQLEIRRWDTGSTTLIASDDNNGNRVVDRNSWHDVEVEINGDTYTAKVYDVDQTTGVRSGDAVLEATATDSNHTSNDGVGVGYRNGTGDGALLDGVRKVGEV